MKKTAIICFMVITALIGCKDGKVDEKNNNNLQGTWEVQRELYIGYKNGVESYRIKDDNKANFSSYVFKGGKIIITSNGGASETYPYKLAGENLDIDKGYNVEHIKLKFNTNTQIVMRYEDTDASSNFITKKVTEFILNKK